MSEAKRMHTCCVCGKTSEWNLSWSWFGSEKELEDGKPVFKVCSDRCKRNAGENCENVKERSGIFKTGGAGVIAVLSPCT